MAKDDYHVIVYQILSYLYQQLKAGKHVDPDCLRSDGKLFFINETYWEYIIRNLAKEGYVEGVILKERRDITGQTRTGILGLDSCQITPKGIEYLSDNSFMEKAKELFKDAKSIIPFV